MKASSTRESLPSDVLPAGDRFLGYVLGLALLGAATALIALVVVLLWLCR